MRQKLRQKLLSPRSASDPDCYRRELITNLLLAGLTTAGIMAIIVSAINRFTESVPNPESSIGILCIFTASLCFFWYLSRRGHYKIAATALFALLEAYGIHLVLKWSFNLPMAQLLLCLSIVIAGVLISAKSGLLVAIMQSMAICIIAWLQANGHLSPNYSWLRAKLEAADALGFALVYSVIALVSWLANREIDQSLKRARTSERKLLEQRDQLELTVKKRTKELEEAQLLRIMELERFAEFGRLSAGLIHDIANPLAAATINLDHLQSRQVRRTTNKKQALAQTVASLRTIESYISAARHQLKQEANHHKFRIDAEIKQILNIIEHRARSADVKLIYTSLSPTNLTIKGNSAKFCQLIGNLIANAIESYSLQPNSKKQKPQTEKRQVKITAKINKTMPGFVEIAVRDWGQGIPEDRLDQIFKPFFSTKKSAQPNMGIGLHLVKQFVEQDFAGNISVTSNPSDGTRFTVNLCQNPMSIKSSTKTMTPDILYGSPNYHEQSNHNQATRTPGKLPKSSQ